MKRQPLSLWKGGKCERYVFVVTCSCFRWRGISHPMSQILSMIWLEELPRRGRVVVEQERQPSAVVSVVQRQSWIQWRFVSAAGAAQPRVGSVL